MTPRTIHGYLLALYGVVSLICFHYYGVNVMVDSERYLSYAMGLREGFYIERHNFWYMGYVSFIYAIKLFSQENLAIVVCQYILGYLAVVSVYESGRLLFGNTRQALFPALLMVAFFKIPMWNSYILSEPFYISFTCFSLYFFVTIYRKGLSRTRLLVAVPIVLLTVMAKPTGIALLGAVLSVLLYSIISKVKTTALKWAICGGVAIMFLLLTNKMLATFTLIENDYVKGEIVYGIAHYPDYPSHDQLIVSPPEDLYIPDTTYPPIIRILTFILHNPIYWLKLFFIKFYYFSLHIRPYWSWTHNLFSLLFLIPVYGLSFRSFLYRKFPKEMLLFLIPYFTIHVLSVCLSTVDWDGRFLMPLLPVLFLLAAGGLPRTAIAVRPKVKSIG